MGNAPDSFNKKTVVRSQIAVVALSAIGIGAFILFWIVLGELGVGDFARLIAAFCIPPVLIAVLVGVYLLSRSDNTKNLD